MELAEDFTRMLDNETEADIDCVRRISEEGDNGWVYYLGDALGTVHQLVDTNGTVTMTQRYEPFGDVRKSIGSVSTNYGFTGEWEDSTGLIHLRARYYNPVVGRFFSVDPFPGIPQIPRTLHPYVYVYNNPANITDPSGLSYLCTKIECPPPNLIGIIGGGIIILGGVGTAAIGVVFLPEIEPAGAFIAVAGFLGVIMGIEVVYYSLGCLRPPSWPEPPLILNPP